MVCDVVGIAAGKTKAPAGGTGENGHGLNEAEHLHVSVCVQIIDKEIIFLNSH